MSSRPLLAGLVGKSRHSHQYRMLSAANHAKALIYVCLCGSVDISDVHDNSSLALVAYRLLDYEDRVSEPSEFCEPFQLALIVEFVEGFVHYFN